MLSLTVFLPLGLLVWPFDRRERLYGALSVVWGRGILALLGVRLELLGTENIDPAERYVVVANHQSTLDPPLLVVALQPHVPIRFLAKRSLFRVPVLGWGMKLYGHVCIDRASIRSSLPEIGRAESEVRTHWSTIFFAEGTRTRTGKLGEFRTGAFRIAARAGVPLLPVSIEGSFEALPPKHYVVRSRPARVRVRVHPPLAAPADREEALAMLERCRAIIASSLGDADSDD